MATLPCPRCGKPMDVAKPAPEQIRCASCGSVFRNSATRPAGGDTGSPRRDATAVIEPATARALARAQTADEAPPGPGGAGKGVLIGIILGGVLVVGGVVGVVIWAVLNRGGDTPTAKKEPAKVEEQPIQPKLNQHPVIKKESVPKPLDPRIDKAREAGVAFLKAQVPFAIKGKGKKAGKGGARSLGELSLIGLTLLECGVKADDPHVVRLAELVRKAAPRMSTTYAASVAILFLDRLNQDKTSEEDRKIIRTLALRIIKGQHSSLWSYKIPILDAAGEKKLEGALLDEGKEYVGDGGAFDLSNTQFAALALWAAKRHKVQVDAPLRAAAQKVRAGQNQKDGTWGYRMIGAHRDTGTCVGLILLSLGRAVADDKDQKQRKHINDPAVVKALNHLANIIVRAKPVAKRKVVGRLIGTDSGGDLYFLWALERTALILKVDKLDKNDKIGWHAWGTEIILKNQLADGSWHERWHIPDTCFALLFLMQHNLFEDLSDKLDEAMGPSPRVRYSESAG